MSPARFVRRGFPVWPGHSLLLLATLLLAACAPPAQTPGSPAPAGGIHVTGHGLIEVEPDMGYVTLQVRREGTDVAALKRTLDDVVAGVLEVTRSLDIAERDVSATAVSITPRYRRHDDRTEVEGVVASRSIVVTLRDLESFGALLDAAVERGVNNLEPLRLDVAARSEHEAHALDLAMSGARAEAARLAEGFDVGLGAVTDVRTHGASPRYLGAISEARVAADSGGAYAPGVIRIERQVQATFAILD